MSEKPAKPWPAIYTWIWTALIEAGRRQGYAMALHGSMARDLDVIAAPWTDEAGSEDDLLGEIQGVLEIYLDDEHKKHPHFHSMKPHGRSAWTLMLGGGAHIDLSVMPRVVKSAQQL